MAVHAAALVQKTQRFACGVPLVLAGDFNVKPNDAVYQFLVRGALPPSHALNHPAPSQMADICTLLATTADQPFFRSTYVEAQGRETEATVKTLTVNHDSPFVDTLDYIFVCSGIDVCGVKEPISAASLMDDVMFPSATEPSDHLLIAADLELSKD